MFNIFKKKKNIPKERDLYAITKYRRGDFVLFTRKTEDNVLEFMRLPDCTQFSINPEEFSEGVISGLFEWVECLPKDVYDVCVANIKII
jgi:hypothetical protein